MQVAIDSAKRSFDISLTDEIKRIKDDMEVKKNGYPVFWLLIRKGFNKDRINEDLICPMNYLYSWKANRFKDKNSTLPITYFFVNHPVDFDKRKSRKVEELIEKYSLKLYRDYQYPTDNQAIDDENRNDNYLILRSDFDDLIADIRQIPLSSNYKGLMSWLINRAFKISSQTKITKMRSQMDKNKSILLKTLYEINKSCFLSCFSKNLNC